MTDPSERAPLDQRDDLVATLRDIVHQIHPVCNKHELAFFVVIADPEHEHGPLVAANVKQPMTLIALLDVCRRAMPNPREIEIGDQQ